MQLSGINVIKLINLIKLTNLMNLINIVIFALFMFYIAENGALLFGPRRKQIQILKPPIQPGKRGKTKMDCLFCTMALYHSRDCHYRRRLYPKPFMTEHKNPVMAHMCSGSLWVQSTRWPPSSSVQITCLLKGTETNTPDG